MNRELLHELLDVVLEVQETGDYACFNVSNHGSGVMVYHISGGFTRERDYDYTAYCNINDTGTLQEMVDYFKGIKKSPHPGRYTGCNERDRDAYEVQI